MASSVMIEATLPFYYVDHQIEILCVSMVQLSHKVMRAYELLAICAQVAREALVSCP